MRRTLAIALTALVLFAGGCDRARRAAPAPATAPTSASTGATTVDDLLREVDQQIDDDARPVEDED
ncbi:hypothetical protein KZZ52_08345 [Dactylosporangium sp. AC04546]|uniref:hypothetical protein n=1 Tax=Dactylosporangium sp. AC04546 TaxID=2862460 RepID=UPI001EDD9E43|nr:hypothetical protein [Dactylosporangium sp. AC04546]WVK85385.1 hypothetical protein KZZ52_08345 [Dactylosporangium sp. AC04546]